MILKSKCSLFLLLLLCSSRNRPALQSRELRSLLCGFVHPRGINWYHRCDAERHRAHRSLVLPPHGGGRPLLSILPPPILPSPISLTFSSLPSPISLTFSPLLSLLLLSYPLLSRLLSPFSFTPLRWQLHVGVKCLCTCCTPRIRRTARNVWAVRV